MIGYIRIADIPQFLISLVIGIVLAIGFVAIFEHFNFWGDTAAAVAAVLFIGILAFSIWAGHRIWNWIEDRFLDR